MSGGRNSRLDEIQAAFLRTKLRYLDEWNQKRRNIARLYYESFRELNLSVPFSTGPDYVAHLFVVRTSQRDEIRRGLASQAITTDIHYPYPDYLQPSCLDLGLKEGYLPITEQACSQVLTLPCFPEMTLDEIHSVVEAVTQALTTV